MLAIENDMKNLTDSDKTIYLLTLVGIIFLAVLYLGILSQTKKNRDFERYRTESDENFHEVLRLDEVLTQSARLYTLTKDEAFKSRYYENVDILETHINKLLLLSNDSQKRKFITMTKESNNFLVGVEVDAMTSVKHKYGKEKYKTLVSEDYIKHKEMYWKGMDQLHNSLIQERLRRQKNDEDRNKYLLTIFLISLGVLLYIIHRLYMRIVGQNKFLKKLSDEAMQASEVKSRFLSNMSHEIRTPLNAIIGLADVLKDSDLQSEALKNVEIIYNASEGLLTIINDILDISKIENDLLKLEEIEIDLVDLIGTTGDLVAVELIGKNVDFIFDIDLGENRIILGDPTRLKQIFLNLLFNSIKFTNEGEIILSAKVNDGFIIFSIKDTGVGISKESLGIIFNSFTQADISTTRIFGGTGLGLSIVKHLVETMGGRIWVESELGVGSNFFFKIPLLLPNKNLITRVSDVEDICLSKKCLLLPKGRDMLRVLIAEDADDNIALFEVYFKLAPLEIDFAKNGIEAMKLFKEKEYDIVLMDMQMPYMDGYECIQEIRKYESLTKRPSVPIIGQSAFAQENEIEKGYEFGCDYYIAKPAKRGAMFDILNKVISERIF